MLVLRHQRWAKYFVDDTVYKEMSCPKRGRPGPPGPAGSTTAYGNIFNVGGQIIPDGDPVFFDSEVTLVGVTYVIGDPNITVPVAGNYRIDFYVMGSNSGPYGITHNGFSVNGSLYSTQPDFPARSGYVIVTAGAGDTFTVINSTGSTDFLPELFPSVNATLIITLLQAF